MGSFEKLMMTSHVAFPGVHWNFPINIKRTFMTVFFSTKSFEVCCSNTCLWHPVLIDVKLRRKEYHDSAWPISCIPSPRKKVLPPEHGAICRKKMTSRFVDETCDIVCLWYLFTGAWSCRKFDELNIDFFLILHKQVSANPCIYVISLFLTIWYFSRCSKIAKTQFFRFLVFSDGFLTFSNIFEFFDPKKK